MGALDGQARDRLPPVWEGDARDPLSTPPPVPSSLQPSASVESVQDVYRRALEAFTRLEAGYFGADIVLVSHEARRPGSDRGAGRTRPSISCGGFSCLWQGVSRTEPAATSRALQDTLSIFTAALLGTDLGRHHIDHPCGPSPAFLTALPAACSASASPAPPPTV